MTNSIIPLKNDIIYGPVDSRRLGRSLGVNVLSPTSKGCPFDCIYCQYGHTRVHALSPASTDRFPTVGEIEEALVDALERIPEPEFLTLSGNGEPTLHPHINDIALMMASVRDRLAPEARTAVLSNSATVMIPEVRKALANLDVRIMKLDAGMDEVFARYNVPCEGVDLESVVQGLSTLQDVTIQTLFAGGSEGNFTLSNIAAWLDCLDRIKPIMVQIYSLDRGTLSKDIQNVERKDLEILEKRLISLGYTARAYARASS